MDGGGGLVFLQCFQSGALVLTVHTEPGAPPASDAVLPEALQGGPVLLVLFPGSGQEVTQENVRILSRESLKPEQSRAASALSEFSPAGGRSLSRGFGPLASACSVALWLHLCQPGSGLPQAPRPSRQE